MNTKDFFIELIAPHVKNIEAQHKQDLPHLDILSEITIVESGKGIELDLKSLPGNIREELDAILSARVEFLNFEVSRWN